MDKHPSTNVPRVKSLSVTFYFNPLTPMSDQNRISPFNINTISTRQVMKNNLEKYQFGDN